MQLLARLSFAAFPKRIVACLALGLLPVALSGCASLGLNGTGDSAPADQSVAKAPEEKEPPVEPLLPEVPLTSDLLYDLLVDQIGSQRGNSEEAFEALSRAAMTARDPRLVARATRDAIRIDRIDDALKFAKLWVELRPDTTGPLEALAMVHLVRNEVDDAETVARQLLRDSDDMGQAYRRIADLMVRQEKRAELLPVLERLVALNPDNADAWYSLAFFADRTEADDRAREAIDKALELKPDWEDAALAKAGYLVQSDRVVEHQTYSEEFLKRNPKASKFRLQFARTLVDQNNVEAAVREFKRVANDEPENIDASYAVGVLSIQNESYRDAEKYLLRVLDVRPDHDQARLYLGQVSRELKQYDKAAAWYTSIDSDAYRFEAQRLLGLLKVQTDDVDAAIAHLNTLSPANDEDQAQLYLTQEQIFREADRLDDAKDVLNEALKVFPDNGDLLYARALVSAQLDELETHEQDLRKLIANEPDNAHAYNALGYTLADQTDRYEEALALVEKALELRPDDPFIIDSMGWVQYRLGNLQEAHDYLRKAHDARADAEIAAHLGEVLWKMGKLDEAREVWDAATRESPDNKILRETILKHLDE